MRGWLFWRVLRWQVLLMLINGHRFLLGWPHRHRLRVQDRLHWHQLRDGTSDSVLGSDHLL
eukprot:EC798188.1.p4 GENE.EC798188.1~~EC798188.1.p4  ORF type:complete len:61 (+),score=8.44 EC798188.1:141-323(+)